MQKKAGILTFTQNGTEFNCRRFYHCTGIDRGMYADRPSSQNGSRNSMFADKIVVAVYAQNKEE